MLELELDTVAQSLADEFTNVGATFKVDDTGISRVTSGISMGDSLVVWNIAIDDQLNDGLKSAFSKMIAIAQTGLYPDRSWGIWLDASNRCYMIESGRIFTNVDDAIRYGVEHDQRYGYDLDRAFAFEVPQMVEVVDLEYVR